MIDISVYLTSLEIIELNSEEVNVVIEPFLKRYKSQITEIEFSDLSRRANDRITIKRNILEAYEKKYRTLHQSSKIKAYLNCLLKSGKENEKSRRFSAAKLDYENCIMSAIIAAEVQHVAIPIFQKAANRLLLLYRKKEDIQDRHRILTLTIEVISKFNNDSYQNALAKYPQYMDLIKESIEQHRGLYVDNKLIMQHIRISRYISKLEQFKSDINPKNT